MKPSDKQPKNLPISTAIKAGAVYSPTTPPTRSPSRDAQ
jgi:hypothetical protein